MLESSLACVLCRSRSDLHCAKILQVVGFLSCALIRFDFGQKIVGVFTITLCMECVKTLKILVSFATALGY